MGLGDELLGKEDSFREAKQEVTASRGSHSSACCHVRVVETLQPACRKDLRFPEETGNEGRALVGS